MCSERLVCDERLIRYYTVSQQLAANEMDIWRKERALGAVLMGDIAAATISATAISPILAAIDR